MQILPCVYQPMLLNQLQILFCNWVPIAANNTTPYASSVKKISGNSYLLWSQVWLCISSPRNVERTFSPPASRIPSHTAEGIGGPLARFRTTTLRTSRRLELTLWREISFLARCRRALKPVPMPCATRRSTASTAIWSRRHCSSPTTLERSGEVRVSLECRFLCLVSGSCWV